MLLRVQGEAVDVDTNSRDVGVVLVGLHLVEIAALTQSETIVAVQLDQTGDHRVLAGHALNAGHGVARLQHGPVPPVRVVEWLLALPGSNHGVIAAHERVALDNPHKLLTGVVEVQLDLVGGAGDGLTASELQGLDQVLVRDLGELATLISVQVDVVHIQRSSGQVACVHTVADGVLVSNVGGVVPAQVAQVVELQVDTNLVVLEGDQRQSQTRVAAEPELQRDEQSVLRGALHSLVHGVGLAASAVIVAVLASLDNQVGQLGHVTHHLGVTSLLAGLLGQLIPDVQPVTIVLVNALATDLQLDKVDQIVPNPVQPAELSTRAISSLELHLRQSGLQVDAVDQITITLNGAGHLVTEPGVSVKGILNGLHCEVGVTTIHLLEECNLRVSSQVDILSTVGDELH